MKGQSGPMADLHDGPCSSQLPSLDTALSMNPSKACLVRQARGLQIPGPQAWPIDPITDYDLLHLLTPFIPVE